MDDEPYDIYDEQPHEAFDEYLANELQAGSDTDEEDETDGDESESDHDDEEVVEILDPARVSSGVTSNSRRTTTDGYVEEEREKRRRVEKQLGVDSMEREDESKEGTQGSQPNRDEIEGLFCPICMDAWTNEGDHHICCLPCGHIFGLSCITRWLKQNRSSAKCPQCNRKSTLKDIRKLFTPRIVALDEESKKRIQALEKKDFNWRKKESEWKKRETELEFRVKLLTERTSYLEYLLDDLQSKHSNTGGRCEGLHASGERESSMFCSQGPSSSCVFQTELLVDGARLLDIDASDHQIILLARKCRMGGSYILTKVSLVPPYEKEDIFIPSRIKTIKDLHISPSNGNHVLFASLGKEISVLSMESNNIVLSYKLPIAAWSCSWDLNSSNYMYAGLQNGSLMVFDVRQTSSPVESRSGLTTNLIHTIRSLHYNSTISSGVRTVLSASSIGVCQWNFGGAEERPLLVPETKQQGVCISLAQCSSSDDIVASFRPKVDTSNEMVASQPLLTPSPMIGQAVLGSHIHLKREGNGFQKMGVGYATVSNIRWPKSTIIGLEEQKPLFAAQDETTNRLVLQELPSFVVAQQLKSLNHFICDVKYRNNSCQGFLGCLSEDTLQLYSTKLG